MTKREVIGLTLGTIVGLVAVAFLFIAIAVGGGLAAQNDTQGFTTLIVAVTISLGVGTLICSAITKSIARDARHVIPKSLFILILLGIVIYFINVLINPSFK